MLRSLFSIVRTQRFRYRDRQACRVLSAVSGRKALPECKGRKGHKAHPARPGHKARLGRKECKGLKEGEVRKGHKAGQGL